MNIKDSVIIVTGAAAGIGKATAELLASRGAKLALVDYAVDSLRSLEASLVGAKAFVADLADQSTIAPLVESIHRHFGRIDVLVNNAGIGLYQKVADFDLAAYRKMFDVNVFAPVLLMKMTIPIMKQQGAGFILNASSRVSKNYFPYVAGYASTKYALNAFSLTARTELEADNIRVGVVIIGITDTGFQNSAAGSVPNELKPGTKSTIDTVITPQEVAQTMVEAIIGEAAETYTKNAVHYATVK